MLHIFVINPIAGTGEFSKHLRKELEKQPNLNYFIFSIRYADYENVLVKQILKYFDEDKLRIYVCGGLGTLHKVINALKERLQDIEIAWYPMGINNNLVHIFKNKNKFMNIENLIHGEVVPIDYIRTNHGIAINNVSFGVDAKSMEFREKYALLEKFSPSLVFSLSVIYSVFITKPIPVTLQFNGREGAVNITQLFFGNGSYIGDGLKFGFDVSITDGKADYLLCKDAKGLKLLNILRIVNMKKKERLMTVCELGLTEKMHVVSKDNIWINIDGEKYTDFNEWDMELVPKGIQFVVPKEVMVP